ncbi:hypothetical protein IFR10_09450 [Bacillus sp. CFBP 13597]|nr:hypothetical protein [Bacillus sp. CFBP 13597]
MHITYKYLIVTIIVSIIAGVLIYHGVNLYEIKGFNKALDGVLLISSISLGFYGACLSVFASLFNTKVVKEIMDDKEYRKEFLIIASLSLAIGFLTVICTIVYQVMLENDGVANGILQITNASWIGLIIMFFSLQLIFVFVSFVIFFKNTDHDKQTDSVYTPNLNESKLSKKK